MKAVAFFACLAFMRAIAAAQLAFPYKLVQTPALIVAIHESDTPGLRQIFLDGRGHPKGA